MSGPDEVSSQPISRSGRAVRGSPDPAQVRPQVSRNHGRMLLQGDLRSVLRRGRETSAERANRSASAERDPALPRDLPTGVRLE